MKNVVAGLVPWCALLFSATVQAAEPADVAPIPRPLCGATLVFLGEASHGGGAAIGAKADMARRLIAECGFDQVAFESQVYDFSALRPPHIRVADLRNAVGGLWSTASELDPLFEWLADRANANALRIVGIDGQLGSASSAYARSALAQDLTRGMPAQRAAACAELLNRLTNWTFDDAHPKDAAFDAALRACAADFVATAQKHGTATQKHLAENLLRFLDFSADDAFDDRDRLMADNLRQASTPGRRTIVWTANVHASRAADRGHTPLASRFGAAAGVASVGITAAAGEFCMYPCRTAQPLAPSAPDSLESTLIAAGKAGRLVALAGESEFAHAPAKLLDYAREETRNWPALFDYVIVLRAERRPTYVRPPRPEP